MNSMLGTTFHDPAGLPSFTLSAIVPPSPILAPALVMVLAIVAGGGTFMLLPSRRPPAVRGLGAFVVLGAFCILAVTLIGYTARQPGGGMDVYFWVFSSVALFGALRVVTHPRPVYAALYFVLTVFASAGIFVLLWAEFMAAALVLIYAGAILITYVFVIMLAASATTPGAKVGKGGNDVLTEYDLVSREPMVASAVGFALMGVLLFVIFDRASVPTYQAAGPRAAFDPRLVQAGQPVPEWGNTQELGVYLFQDHMVNLELAGLILTLSMVGAIIIARRKVYWPDEPMGGAGVDTFDAPMTPIDDNPHSIPVFGTDNPRQKAWPET
jgi:NADH-quinone oxidoreductase subunit J